MSALTHKMFNWPQYATFCSTAELAWGWYLSVINCYLLPFLVCFLVLTPQWVLNLKPRPHTFSLFPQNTIIWSVCCFHTKISKKAVLIKVCLLPKKHWSDYLLWLLDGISHLMLFFSFLIQLHVHIQDFSLCVCFPHKSQLEDHQSFVSPFCPTQWFSPAYWFIFLRKIITVISRASNQVFFSGHPAYPAD